MFRFLFIFNFSICSLGIIEAQQNKAFDYALKLNSHFGFIMEHSNSMGNLVKGHIYGAGLELAKPTDGSSLWHYENNFPERGLSLGFFNLSNKEQLGSIIYLAPFYDIPLNAKKKHPLILKLALGPSIATKRFDPILNHKNNVISAFVNAYVNFKWMYRFYLGENYRIETGLNFSHASNGKFKAPNLGVNMLTYTTAIAFTQKKNTSTKSPIRIDSSAVFPFKTQLSIIAAIGFNEMEPPGGRKYPAYILNTNYYLNKRNTHRFGVGLDFYYSVSIQDELYASDSIRLSNKWKYIQFGPKLSYNYLIGKVALPVEFGYYAYTPYKGNGTFFHRVALQYYYSNNLILHFGLKTHWFVANYFEYGLGYRIGLKKKK